MIMNVRRLRTLLATVALIAIASPIHVMAQSRDVVLTIHLKSVYESKISLMARTGTGTIKPISEVPGVKKGGTTKFTVSRNNLPGEFVLRFDYKESQSGTPYPCEKNLFISQQDLELWASPKYCNNPDSTRFQKGELENSGFAGFSKETSRQKEKIGILQQFLLNYDDTKSKFYLSGIEEYDKRRLAYNQWMENRIKTDKSLFVSSFYRLNYIPPISFTGTEKERLFSVINHYFDGMDFNDPALTKTSRLNDWMDSYVNLHAQMATTPALRDSLIPAAAVKAIEKSKKGNPVVYGWMVDYFYKGFETNNLPSGMKILQPYLNDPKCLTSKRMEIQRRLMGIETLVVGSKAPDFELRDLSDKPFRFYGYTPSTQYILLFFWSAGCSHCTETVDAIFPWQKQPEIARKVTVVAVSLDETEAELDAYRKKVPVLQGWKHMKAPEGTRSKVANDYFILATPVMILIDSRTKEIVSLPASFPDLKSSMK